jgi:hypothetical protein
MTRWSCRRRRSGPFPRTGAGLKAIAGRRWTPITAGWRWWCRSALWACPRWRAGGVRGERVADGDADLRAQGRDRRLWRLGQAWHLCDGLACAPPSSGQRVAGQGASASFRQRAATRRARSRRTRIGPARKPPCSTMARSRRIVSSTRRAKAAKGDMGDVAARLDRDPGAAGGGFDLALQVHQGVVRGNACAHVARAVAAEEAEARQVQIEGRQAQRQKRLVRVFQQTLRLFAKENEGQVQVLTGSRRGRGRRNCCTRQAERRPSGSSSARKARIIGAPERQAVLPLARGGGLRAGDRAGWSVIWGSGAWRNCRQEGAEDPARHRAGGRGCRPPPAWPRAPVQQRPTDHGL